MGQRHQIYIVLPYTIKQKRAFDSDEVVESNIVALHHQWLFGYTAGMQLENFLKFFENQKDNKYGVFTKGGKYTNGAEDVSKALYSTNVNTGYFSNVSIESNDYVQNPLIGDNNDGITIIDLRNNKPKYCFMFIGAGGQNSEHYTPLNAKQYMDDYYGDHQLLENRYWKENEKDFRRAQEKVKEVDMKLKQYEVLTMQEVKSLFPKMF